MDTLPLVRDLLRNKLTCLLITLLATLGFLGVVYFTFLASHAAPNRNIAIGLVVLTFVLIVYRAVMKMLIRADVIIIKEVLGKNRLEALVNRE